MISIDMLERTKLPTLESRTSMSIYDWDRNQHDYGKGRHEYDKCKQSQCSNKVKETSD